MSAALGSPSRSGRKGAHTFKCVSPQLTHGWLADDSDAHGWFGAIFRVKSPFFLKLIDPLCTSQFKWESELFRGLYLNTQPGFRTLSK